MGLNTNDVTVGGGVKPQKYYIGKQHLKRLENLGQPEYLSDPVDLAIRLVWTPENQSFEVDLDIFGNFERGGMGEITGWGGAFTVGEALKMLGFENLELTDDGEIPHVIFDRAPGRPFYSLRYVAKRKDDGRLSYYTFKRIMGTPEMCSFVDDEEDAHDQLERLFLYQVDEGWVGDYSPELIDGDAEDEPAREPVGAGVHGEDKTFEPDDELPF